MRNFIDTQFNLKTKTDIVFRIRVSKLS